MVAVEQVGGGLEDQGVAASPPLCGPTGGAPDGSPAKPAAANASHTPGPWLTQQEPDGEWSVWTRQPYIGTLATVHAEDMNGPYPAEANARLMAGTPIMWRALEAIDAVFSRVPFNANADTLNDAIELMGDLARDAIARARGQ